MFSTYAKLPDVLSVAELQSHFDQVIAGLQSGPQATDSARDLLELALRQVNSGEALDAARSQAICEWIQAQWQPVDEVLTDRLLGSIVNLNLQACVSLLDNALADANTPEESRELIAVARGEL